MELKKFFEFRFPERFIVVQIFVNIRTISIIFIHIFRKFYLNFRQFCLNM